MFVAESPKKNSLIISAKSYLKILLARASLIAFANSLGIKINFIYWLHHFYCRITSRIVVCDEDWAREKANEITVNGYTKIDPIDCRELASRVSSFFSTIHIDSKAGEANLSEGQKETLAPLVFAAVQGNVEKVLSAYYKSYTQPYWINVMRYIPGYRSSNSSFGYHIDDNPKQLLKIFIYLNDTFKSNGAFRAFDYKNTRSFIRRGFISSSEELRCKSQKYISTENEKSDLKILEGKAGTILIFDNNLVHKGTLPESGYRDTVCIEIYPGNKPWTLQDFKKGLAAPIKIDYPANPFLNDILSQ